MRIKDIDQLILEIIDEKEGHCNWNLINPKIKAYYFSNRESNEKIIIPTDRQITHTAYLLERDEAVERLIEIAGIYYRLTPWGHAKLGPWYKTLSYFLVYKNHNVIALIALILSIISIILSRLN